MSMDPGRRGDIEAGATAACGDHAGTALTHLELQGRPLRVDPGAGHLGHNHAQATHSRQTAVEAALHACHQAGQQLWKDQRTHAKRARGEGGNGTGRPFHQLTVSASPEFRVPQMRQANENSLADVALLRQGRVADGAAAAPRLQQLLQRLGGGTALAWSDSPAGLPSIPSRGCPLPVPPAGGPGTLQGLRARQDLPGGGVDAVGCPWPGTPAGSAAQASATEAGRLVTVCQADTTHLPPAWQGSPVGTGLG